MDVTTGLAALFGSVGATQYVIAPIKVAYDSAKNTITETYSRSGTRVYQLIVKDKGLESEEVTGIKDMNTGNVISIDVLLGGDANAG